MARVPRFLDLAFGGMSCSVAEGLEFYCRITSASTAPCTTLNPQMCCPRRGTPGGLQQMAHVPRFPDLGFGVWG